MAIVKCIFIVLEVVLIFNLLIFVHELGHFLAARWRGLKVDRFAIWFGKPIWKKKINGVEYALGTIPAGGYVSLPQMASMEMIEGKGESSGQPLPAVAPLDKIIVAVAGPLFSLLLGFVFAVIVWQVGKPENAGTTEIGWVDPNGPAWNAGLRPGDVITAIDGHRVRCYAPPSQDSITWRIVTSKETNIVIDYTREKQPRQALVTPTNLPTQWYERKSLRKVLIRPADRSIVYEVASNSPAAQAGLKKGDEIVALNGERLYNPDRIGYEEQTMTNGPLKPMRLTIVRGTQQFDQTLTPEKPLSPTNSWPMLGITYIGDTNLSLSHPGPLDQVRTAAGQIYATLATVFSRKGDVGVQQLGGPVMIVRLYYNLFQSEDGWRMVLWFSVVLNVNLALFNMLPFPVLDGGHILLSLIEAVRRRPVSAKILHVLQSACALVLIGFMLFLTFYDAGDWVRSARKHDEPLIFAPKH
jgi:regulator of sigma E protease